MNTSENKKRVLDLVWKNYEGQVGSSRRAIDRVAIVLGASVAGVGLMFNDVSIKSISSTGGQLSLVALLVFLIGAFVCAWWAWVPVRVGVPSGSDVNELWHYLVAVDDDASAATMINDICRATEEEEQFTLRLTWWLRACMMCCGLAMVSSMSLKLFTIG